MYISELYINMYILYFRLLGALTRAQLTVLALVTKFFPRPEKKIWINVTFVYI